MVLHPEDDMTESQINVIFWISYILSGISVIGCTLVVILYLRFKKIRTFILEPVVFLCFWEAVNHLVIYIPNTNLNEKPNLNCTIQGFIGSFSDVSSLIWTGIISYTSIMSLVELKHLKSNQKLYRVVFILISMIIPGVLSLV